MNISKQQINIYCDESRHTSGGDRYMVIGAIKCDRELKKDIVHQIHLLKQKHNTQGEFGWKRLSPNKKDFYFEILNIFLENEINFRCIVVDKEILNHDLFNDGDKELGFYKFYYLMLREMLEPNDEYHIYLDWQQNKEQNRFRDLKYFLQKKLQGKAKISCLEPVTSKNQPMIELTDLLIGAVGYEINERDSSTIKVEFCKQFAKSLNFEKLGATTKNQKKCNIFKWIPKNGI